MKLTIRELKWLVSEYEWLVSEYEWLVSEYDPVQSLKGSRKCKLTGK